jgi:GNAT superfamily N-acetyltransferase
VPQIRPFARHDRDQLLSLANHHIACVLPGGSIPASTLLAHMEHDVHEYVIDPWVTERRTIIGTSADRLVAAAHLKRYGNQTPPVSTSFADAGVIDWLICWPNQMDTGQMLLRAALDQFRQWQTRIWYADGSLPCLGVYGISDAWPHIQALVTDAGFDDREGRVEVIFAGELSAVEAPGPAPCSDLTVRRVLGNLGTSFQAILGDEVVGVFEVEDDYTRGGSVMALDGWADEDNHWVREDLRGRGIGSWLFRHGCSWLRLGGSRRILTYALEDEDLSALARYYGRHGLVPINRTRRGWRRLPAVGAEVAPGVTPRSSQAARTAPRFAP